MIEKVISQLDVAYKHIYKRNAKPSLIMIFGRWRMIGKRKSPILVRCYVTKHFTLVQFGPLSTN